MRTNTNYVKGLESRVKELETNCETLKRHLSIPNPALDPQQYTSPNSFPSTAENPRPHPQAQQYFQMPSQGVPDTILRDIQRNMVLTKLSAALWQRPAMTPTLRHPASLYPAYHLPYATHVTLPHPPGGYSWHGHIANAAQRAHTGLPNRYQQQQRHYRHQMHPHTRRNLNAKGPTDGGFRPNHGNPTEVPQYHSRKEELPNPRHSSNREAHNGAEVSAESLLQPQPIPVIGDEEIGGSTSPMGDREHNHIPVPPCNNPGNAQENGAKRVIAEPTPPGHPTNSSPKDRQ
jgi:hypothetical protein